MSETSNAEFGVTRFTYSKDHVERIFDYLESNHGNVVKVFDCIWSEKIFESQHENAPMILHLIDRIERARNIAGRSFERLWNEMHLEARSTGVMNGDWEYNHVL